jgi:hypothetical protein
MLLALAPGMASVRADRSGSGLRKAVYGTLYHRPTFTNQNRERGPDSDDLRRAASSRRQAFSGLPEMALLQCSASLHERPDDLDGIAVFPGHKLLDAECHVLADVEVAFAVGREEMESPDGSRRDPHRPPR